MSFVIHREGFGEREMYNLHVVVYSVKISHFWGHSVCWSWTALTWEVFLVGECISWISQQQYSFYSTDITCYSLRAPCGNFLVNKKCLFTHEIVSCVSLRSDKCVACISFLRKHLQSWLLKHFKVCARMHAHPHRLIAFVVHVLLHHCLPVSNQPTWYSQVVLLDHKTSPL